MNSKMTTREPMASTTPGSRRSRFVRSPNPPGMVLMPRDLQLLELLARFRRLTSQQIRTLLPFGSIQTASYRLQRLWQHSYVDRDYWPVALGSSPAIYRVARRGARALAAHLGGDAEDYTVTSGTQDQIFLDHTLAVNDVLIAFVVAARRASHQVSWRIPTQPLDRLPDPLESRSTVPILPDATMQYQVDERKLQAFLEVDRGTESTKRFASKVRGYFAYLASGNYQRQSGLRSFRLLVVAPGSKRLDSLVQAVEKAAGETASRLGLVPDTCLTLVWYAVQKDVRPETVLGEIWVVSGRRTSLLLSARG
ncbi:MAG: hypothetical protein FJ014_19320 [Chloroflexi bacterium]|nr:hypothetical protein [Chloroflexota bacterium]